jgi:hypothetical protein
MCRWSCPFRLGVCSGGVESTCWLTAPPHREDSQGDFGIVARSRYKISEQVGFWRMPNHRRPAPGGTITAEAALASRYQLQSEQGLMNPLVEFDLVQSYLSIEVGNVS